MRFLGVGILDTVLGTAWMTLFESMNFGLPWMRALNRGHVPDSGMVVRGKEARLAGISVETVCVVCECGQEEDE